MRLGRILLLPAVATLFLAGPAAAQTFQEEMAYDLGVVKDKFVGLAQAIPEDSYSWRPSDGVRSVSEVFMHIALANIGLPASLVGADMPAGVPSEWMDQGESLSGKDNILAALETGFDHLIQVVSAMPTADLENDATVFGRETNVRGALMLMQTHSHEHLGQMIAYARSNGVVPPWSN